jgi:hypothetical protein
MTPATLFTTLLPTLEWLPLFIFKVAEEVC